MGEGIQQTGRFLIFFGIIMVLLGCLLLFSGRIPWLGKLPGDFVIHRKSFTLYFPLATSIVISILITLLFWILGRHR